MTLCPAIFGRYIPSFDIADLMQPMVKVGCLVRSAVGRSTVEESDQRCCRLLRLRPKWPRGRRAAKQRGEPASRQVKHVGLAPSAPIAGRRPAVRRKTGMSRLFRTCPTPLSQYAMM
jgi:hypothetical protein